MTNYEIIEAMKQDLAKEGILQYTGRVFEAIVTDENGETVKVQVPEVEEIHTFTAWKQYGRQVKKGSKAVAAFKIWKHTTKTVEIETKDGKKEDSEIENMFLKMSHWFTFDQTEPITAH